MASSPMQNTFIFMPVLEQHPTLAQRCSPQKVTQVEVLTSNSDRSDHGCLQNKFLSLFPALKACMKFNLVIYSLGDNVAGEHRAPICWGCVK